MSQEFVKEPGREVTTKTCNQFVPGAGALAVLEATTFFREATFFSASLSEDESSLESSLELLDVGFFLLFTTRAAFLSDAANKMKHLHFKYSFCCVVKIHQCLSH